MNVMIRRSRFDDADAIATIAAESLSAAVDPAAPRVRRILSEGRALVATAGESVLGFADAFITTDATGICRLELDLLAVAPGAERNGIGSALVAQSMASAAPARPSLVRALVRTTNLGMQRLCQRAGFQRSASAFALYIAASLPASAYQKADHGARVIPVSTLTYAGVWLEGSLNQAAINLASAMLSRTEAQLAGAVVPLCDSKTAALLDFNRFTPTGHYYWWTRRLRSDQS